MLPRVPAQCRRKQGLTCTPRLRPDGPPGSRLLRLLEHEELLSVSSLERPCAGVGRGQAAPAGLPTQPSRERQVQGALPRC